MGGVSPIIPPPEAPKVELPDARPSELNVSLPQNVIKKVVQWLCDNGCGQDLVGKGVLSARHLPYVESAPRVLSFQTANGVTNITHIVHH